MGRAKRGEMPQPKQSKKSKAKVVAAIKASARLPKHTDLAAKSSSQNLTNIGQDIEHDRSGKHPPLIELTDKHLYFAKRYALNQNASKAAREAGFNEWYGGNVLAYDPLIMKEVARIRASRANKFDVSADRVIAELAKVAFGTLDDFLILGKDGTPIIDCSDLGREEMAALQEITQDTYTERTGPDDFERVKKTKIKLHSKVQALEQLARIFKLFGEGGELDKNTPEEKAARIRAVLKAMKETDGDGKDKKGA